MDSVWIKLIIFLQAASIIEGSGFIETNFIEFENFEGRRFDGKCCDKNSWWNSDDKTCNDECDHNFVLCMGNATESSSMSACEFGKKKIETVGGNRITFNGNVGDYENPVKFPFKQWPGVVKLKIDVQDQDDDEYDFVDHYEYQYNTLALGRELDASKKSLVLTGTRTRFNMELKVFCDINHYGTDCGTYCEETDDHTGHYRCDPATGDKICMSGWIGTECLTNIDDCEGNGCSYGSTCIDGINSYTCRCPPGRTGHTCHAEINECASRPCQNGGRCKDATNSFRCVCRPGFVGLTCQIELDECMSGPCQNGGECTDGLASFTCSCPAGFEGDRCEIDLNECEFSPCVQAEQCVDLPGDFRCECFPGFTGKICDVNIDECLSNPCQNDGACIEGINSYTCACKFGFTGPDCAEAVDFCNPNYCENGASCSSTSSGFVCECPDAFTGMWCEMDLNECEVSPNICGENGRCINLYGNYLCDCNDGYEGRKCDIDTDECNSVETPCFNGGTCVDQIGEYECQCPKGYTGETCDTDILECESSPCVNSGVCIDKIDGYLCKCPIGYTGVHCEIQPITSISTTSTTPHLTSTTSSYFTIDESESISHPFPISSHGGFTADKLEKSTTSVSTTPSTSHLSTTTSSYLTTDDSSNLTDVSDVLSYSEAIDSVTESVVKGISEITFTDDFDQATATVDYTSVYTLPSTYDVEKQSSKSVQQQSKGSTEKYFDAFITAEMTELSTDGDLQTVSTQPRTIGDVWVDPDDEYTMETTSSIIASTFVRTTDSSAASITVSQQDIEGEAITDELSSGLSAEEISGEIGIASGFSPGEEYVGFMSGSGLDKDSSESIAELDDVSSSGSGEKETFVMSNKSSDKPSLKLNQSEKPSFVWEESSGQVIGDSKDDLINFTEFQLISSSGDLPTPTETLEGSGFTSGDDSEERLIDSVQIESGFDKGEISGSGLFEYVYYPDQTGPGVVDTEISGSGLVDDQAIGSGLISSGVVDSGISGSGLVDDQAIGSGLISSGEVDSDISGSGLVDEQAIDSGLISSGVVESDISGSGFVDDQAVGSRLISSGAVDNDISGSGLVDDQAIGSGLISSGVVESDISGSGLVDDQAIGSGLISSGVVDSDISGSGFVDDQTVDSGLISFGEVDSDISGSGLVDELAIGAGLISSGVVDSDISGSGFVDDQAVGSGLISSGVVDSDISGSGFVDDQTVGSGLISSGVVDSDISGSGLVGEQAIWSGQISSGVVDTGISGSGLVDEQTIGSGLISSGVVDSDISGSGLVGEQAIWSGQISSGVVDTGISGSGFVDDQTVGSGLISSGVVDSDISGSGLVGEQTIWSGQISSGVVDTGISGRRLVDEQTIGSGLISSGVVDSAISGSGFVDDQSVGSGLISSGVVDSDISGSGFVDDQTVGSGLISSGVVDSDISGSGFVGEQTIWSGQISSGVVDTGISGSGLVDEQTIGYGLISSGVVDSDISGSGFVDDQSVGSGLISSGVVDSAISGSGFVDDQTVGSGLISSGVVDSDISGRGLVGEQAIWSGQISSGVVDTGISGSGLVDEQTIGSGLISSGVVDSDISGSGLVDDQAVGSGLISSGVVDSDISGSGLVDELAIGSGLISSGAVDSDISGSGLVDELANGSGVIGSAVVDSDISGSGLVDDQTVGSGLISSGVVDSDISGSGLVDEQAIGSGLISSGVVDSDISGSGFVDDQAVGSGLISSGAVDNDISGSGLVDEQAIGSGLISSGVVDSDISGSGLVDEQAIWSGQISSGVVDSDISGSGELNVLTQTDRKAVEHVLQTTSSEHRDTGKPMKTTDWVESSGIYSGDDDAKNVRYTEYQFASSGDEESVTEQSRVTDRDFETKFNTIQLEPLDITSGEETLFGEGSGTVMSADHTFISQSHMSTINDKIGDSETISTETSYSALLLENSSPTSSRDNKSEIQASKYYEESLSSTAVAMDVTTTGYELINGTEPYTSTPSLNSTHTLQNKTEIDTLPQINFTDIDDTKPTKEMATFKTDVDSLTTSSFHKTSMSDKGLSGVDHYGLASKVETVTGSIKADIKTTIQSMRTTWTSNESVISKDVDEKPFNPWIAAKKHVKQPDKFDDNKKSYKPRNPWLEARIYLFEKQKNRKVKQRTKKITSRSTVSTVTLNTTNFDQDLIRLTTEQTITAVTDGYQDKNHTNVNISTEKPATETTMSLLLHTKKTITPINDTTGKRTENETTFMPDINITNSTIQYTMEEEHGQQENVTNVTGEINNISTDSISLRDTSTSTLTEAVKHQNETTPGKSSEVYTILHDDKHTFHLSTENPQTSLSEFSFTPQLSTLFSIPYETANQTGSTHQIEESVSKKSIEDTTYAPGYSQPLDYTSLKTPDSSTVTDEHADSFQRRQKQTTSIAQTKFVDLPELTTQSYLQNDTAMWNEVSLATGQHIVDQYNTADSNAQSITNSILPRTRGKQETKTISRTGEPQDTTDFSTIAPSIAEEHVSVTHIQASNVSSSSNLYKTLLTEQSLSYPPTETITETSSVVPHITTIESNERAKHETRDLEFSDSTKLIRRGTAEPSETWKSKDQVRLITNQPMFPRDKHLSFTPGGTIVTKDHTLDEALTTETRDLETYDSTKHIRRGTSDPSETLKPKDKSSWITNQPVYSQDERSFSSPGKTMVTKDHTLFEGDFTAKVSNESDMFTGVPVLIDSKALVETQTEYTAISTKSVLQPQYTDTDVTKVYQTTLPFHKTERIDDSLITTDSMADKVRQMETSTGDTSTDIPVTGSSVFLSSSQNKTHVTEGASLSSYSSDYMTLQQTSPKSIHTLEVESNRSLLDVTIDRKIPTSFTPEAKVESSLSPDFNTGSTTKTSKEELVYEGSRKGSRTFSETTEPFSKTAIHDDLVSSAMPSSNRYMRTQITTSETNTESDRQTLTTPYPDIKHMTSRTPLREQSSQYRPIKEESTLHMRTTERSTQTDLFENTETMDITKSLPYTSSVENKIPSSTDMPSIKTKIYDIASSDIRGIGTISFNAYDISVKHHSPRIFQTSGTFQTSASSDDTKTDMPKLDITTDQYSKQSTAPHSSTKDMPKGMSGESIDVTTLSDLEPLSTTHGRFEENETVIQSTTQRASRGEITVSDERESFTSVVEDRERSPDYAAASDTTTLGTSDDVSDFKHKSVAGTSPSISSNTFNVSKQFTDDISTNQRTSISSPTVDKPSKSVDFQFVAHTDSTTKVHASADSSSVKYATSEFGTTKGYPKERSGFTETEYGINTEENTAETKSIYFSEQLTNVTSDSKFEQSSDTFTTQAFSEPSSEPSYQFLPVKENTTYKDVIIVPISEEFDKEDISLLDLVRIVSDSTANPQTTVTDPKGLATEQHSKHIPSNTKYSTITGLRIKESSTTTEMEYKQDQTTDKTITSMDTVGHMDIIPDLSTLNRDTIDDEFTTKPSIMKETTKITDVDTKPLQARTYFTFQDLSTQSNEILSSSLESLSTESTFDGSSNIWKPADDEVTAKKQPTPSTPGTPTYYVKKVTESPEISRSFSFQTEQETHEKHSTVLTEKDPSNILALFQTSALPTLDISEKHTFHGPSSESKPTIEIVHTDETTFTPYTGRITPASPTEAPGKPLTTLLASDKTFTATIEPLQTTTRDLKANYSSTTFRKSNVTLGEILIKMSRGTQQGSKVHTTQSGVHSASTTAVNATRPSLIVSTYPGVTYKRSFIRHKIDLTSNNTYPHPRKEIYEYDRNTTLAKGKARLTIKRIRVTVIRTVSSAIEAGKKVVLQTYQRVKNITTRIRVATYDKSRQLLKLALDRVEALFKYCEDGINHFVVKPLLDAKEFVRERFNNAYVRLGEVFRRGKLIFKSTAEDVREETQTYFQTLANYYTGVYRQYSEEVRDIFESLKIPDA